MGCSENNYMVHHATVEAEQEQIRWNNYSQTLLLTAHYTKKPALIYFHSDSCSACEDMESKTLSDRKVIYLINNSYVPIRISDSEDQFHDVANRFNLKIDGGVPVPSMIILSSTNIPKEIIRVSGFIDAMTLALVLESSVTIDVLARVEDSIDQLFQLPEEVVVP
ncbi:hypothetical protein LCGC14_0413630 [marine sediment metagenome]|uniref:Spermatogenesis-associated protein 20-like TRX domain-containing protein n=1 Tax=marine sediment metagenome TaxID=412755 RepID=A0A0F9VEZ5_9ZZZZ